ncbi:PIN domain-containing protein [Jatrophihabitans lederbergiae]|uniref:PIN domain-containing protein n=1 Tax=Jatrophihabitans lederbergiae TaxID=3075547 RepID=A0ABU2J8Y6_9ACTN|nr:PIN domain-containing protein [Jatrophihabitans sp. DSM 44399]MDT0261446.1 PIN domain-containing protein [Jatrophihabitans sp. DSM 44399]
MNHDPDNRSILVDACALIPQRLMMTLLWLAEANVFEVLWSAAILDEVEKNLHKKLGLTPGQAASRVGQMRDGFDAALVDDFDHLIDGMTCHEKDRHVLAAAVRAGAGTLVTFNLKDFPAESTAEHGINVMHPDLFLARLLVEQRPEVLSALQAGVADLHKPPMTTQEFLASLTHTVPLFVNLAADSLKEPDEEVSPIPAMVSADESETLAAFGEPGDLTNPAQVAMLWWSGLLNNLGQARQLTYEESAWGDYQWAMDMLEGRALASKVIPAVDAPYLVAFMRFVPEPATTVHVFNTFATTAVVVLLTRVEDGTWRVWGLGSNMVAARDIVGEEMARLAQFLPGGGTGMVFEWLERIAEPDPPVEIVWDSVDDPLRLSLAQGWLLGTEVVTLEDPDRDGHAEALSARGSTHPLFDTFYADLVAHFQQVYSDIDGNPALVGHTETVGVGLELIVFTTDDVAKSHDNERAQQLFTLVIAQRQLGLRPPCPRHNPILRLTAHIYGAPH